MSTVQSVLHMILYFFYYYKVFIATGRLFSSCSERGCSLVAACGLLIALTSLLAEHRLQACGLQESWCRGLAAPQHVGSSQTRNPAHVSHWQIF